MIDEIKIIPEIINIKKIKSINLRPKTATGKKFNNTNTQLHDYTKKGNFDIEKILFSDVCFNFKFSKIN